MHGAGDVRIKNSRDAEIEKQTDRSSRLPVQSAITARAAHSCKEIQSN